MNESTSEQRWFAAWWRGRGGSAFRFLLLLAAVAAVYLFQTRNLLETGAAAAPPLALETLDGGRFDLHRQGDLTTLVYFFAPWCHVCAASAHNLRATRRSQPEDELAIVLVALDWQSVEEVRRYVEEHGLDVTTLLGDRNTAADWQVPGFPTYYVIDRERRIAHRDFGYTTEFGLWWRTRWAD